MLRVGLTGGIACGKSLVLGRLAAAGIPTLDLDRVAHEVMAPGAPAYADVVAAFGAGILGSAGVIDRRALGAIVFADPAARARLDALVHPRVREAEARHAEAVADGGESLLVTDAALLVEAGIHLRFDRLVVVACRPEQQIARLRERDGLDEATARGRLDAQMPIAAKRRFGHTVLDTSGSREESRSTSELLAGRLRELAAAPRPARAAVARERALRALSFAPPAGPGGVDTAAVARVLVERSGLDLAALAALVNPRVPGPWWRAAEQRGRPGVGPEADEGAALATASLVTPLVLHELGRHGPDPERVAASAHSLAWLLERDPGRLAAAVQLALVLSEVALLGQVPHDLGARAARLRAPAERWGGGSPSAPLERVFEAAAAHPDDARAAATAAGPPGASLAGALVALAGGSGEGPAGPDADAFSLLLDSLESGAHASHG